MLAAFKFTGASLRIFGLDLSQHPFTTGGRQLLFPGVLRNEAFAWAALLAFALCAAAYLIKCSYEVAQRRLNVPKTLHMTLSAGLFFITPALENLDVAFQAMNTWHSFQYKAHGMNGAATGRPLRCPRLGPVRRRHRVDRRPRRALPRPARPPAPGRRLAGRRDAAALLLLPPHRLHHHPAAWAAEPAYCPP